MTREELLQSVAEYLASDEAKALRERLEAARIADRARIAAHRAKYSPEELERIDREQLALLEAYARGDLRLPL